MCHMSYQWCLRAEFLMCPPQLHQGLGGHPCSCQGFHHPNPTKFEPDHLHTMLYHSTSSSPPSGWPHVLHNFIKCLEDIHVLDRVSIIQILPILNQITSILCSTIFAFFWCWMIEHSMEMIWCKFGSTSMMETLSRTWVSSSSWMGLWRTWGDPDGGVDDVEW